MAEANFEMGFINKKASSTVETYTKEAMSDRGLQTGNWDNRDLWSLKRANSEEKAKKIKRRRYSTIPILLLHIQST